MSELESNVENDLAGYTPFNTNDYLILVAMIGTVVTILAISVYTYYQSKREDVEDNSREKAMAEVLQYQNYGHPESDKFKISKLKSPIS